MPDPTILTLIRHGETSANLDGVWHGSTDTPLTERGRAQAMRVGAYIGEFHASASVLYSSQLQRARHTAQSVAAALGLETRIDPALAEFDLGEWEGKSYSDLFQKDRLWHEMKRDPDFAPHGGESPRTVLDRLSGGLRRIATEHPAERVVIVTHGGALSMVLGDLLDGDYSQWRRVMDNCAVSELVLTPEPELLSFNYTDHLTGI